MRVIKNYNSTHEIWLVDGMLWHVPKNTWQGLSTFAIDAGWFTMNWDKHLHWAFTNR